ncbi:MAG: 16S rRNA (guanine(966)-N(2))-methyltransferase RsmD [Candidatus Eremiobacteraeota bacterium]|nr:16S rRNA (guanine(966)-N(2))-methyltransferase RsmD [Candidatus Eremiobacteraeota bacterium]MBV9646613.1 16S rRNA (guanine(966)-N(2))-methyltransferase RsmD [Candidatus Eremiobacteraeota bacterium]
MRLSGGALRSRRVAVPRGAEIRPTPGRVREALFSIIGTRVNGARVLDVYAGTGIVGFEALSRGAAHVTFIEARQRTAAQIRALAAELGVSERVWVLAVSAERAPALLHEPYDIVYADPPYARGLPAGLFARLRLRGVIDTKTLVIYEHRAAAPMLPEGMRSLRLARYGDVALSFMQPDG